MRVVIENYNSKKNCYQDYKLLYKDLTIQGLIELLEKIPKTDPKVNNIVVATKEFVIQKNNENNYLIKPNETTRSHHELPLNLKDLDKLYNDKKFRKRYFKIGQSGDTHGDAVFGEIMYMIVFCTLPFFNFMTLLINISDFINHINLILILLVLSFSSILYFIIETIQNIKEPIVGMKYSIEFIDEIKSVNMTGIIVMISQLFYPIIFHMYDMYLFILFDNQELNYILLLSYFFYIPFLLRDIFKIRFTFKKKKHILNDLSEIVNRSNYKLKDYYLKIYFHLEQKRIVKFGILPSLVTIILTILSIFPFIPKF